MYFCFQTVSSHGAHGVATGDEYCIEIMTNYRYMLSSCATARSLMNDVVIRIRDLCDTPSQAALSASLFPATPLCPSVQASVIVGGEVEEKIEEMW